MVGDPQQLPATLFSQAAKQLALERSLFERLAEVRNNTILPCAVSRTFKQASLKTYKQQNSAEDTNCAVRMLSMQYGMHPAVHRRCITVKC